MDDPVGTTDKHAKQSLRLWLRLLQVTTLVEKTVRSYLRERCGTTLPRFDVLSTLDRAQAGLTMSELSEKLLVSNGNVTGVVARLAEDGLVSRETDASDRRVQRVFLTNAGRATFKDLAQHHEALIDHIMASLADADMERLIQLTTHLGEAARKQLESLRLQESD